MKKFLIFAVTLIFVVSILFMGVSCKEEAVEEAVQEETTEEETTEEETTEEETASAEKVTLLWHSYGEEEAAGWDDFAKETIEIYMERNPNIEIIFEPVPAANLWEVFGAELAAQEGADIQSGWDAMWSMQWVFRDAVAPIGDYLPAEVWDKVLVSDTYFFKGKYWAMPMWLVGHFNYVNTSILEESGVESLPSTWDELLAACEKIRAAGYDPINTGNLEGWGAVNWTTNFLDINYSSINEMMALFAEPQDFHDEKHSGSLYLWRELVDKGYFNADAASLPYYEGWEQFQNGKAAFTVSLAGMSTTFVDKLGLENLDVLPYWPNDGEGKFAKQHNNGAQPVFISAWSPHKQEAADFIAFLASTERTQAMNEIAGVLPANSEFDASGLNTVAEKIFNLLLEGRMQYSGVTPSYTLNEGVSKIIGNIYVKDIPVEKIIDDYAKLVEQNTAQTPELMEGYIEWYESYLAAGK